MISLSTSASAVAAGEWRIQLKNEGSVILFIVSTSWRTPCIDITPLFLFILFVFFVLAVYT